MKKMTREIYWGDNSIVNELRKDHRYIGVQGKTNKGILVEIGNKLYSVQLNGVIRPVQMKDILIGTVAINFFAMWIMNEIYDTIRQRIRGTRWTTVEDLRLIFRLRYEDDRSLEYIGIYLEYSTNHIENCLLGHLKNKKLVKEHERLTSHYIHNFYDNYVKNKP